MTVTYTLRVSNARLMGFSKLLFMWKGGIYKLVYKEMVIFVTLYATLSLVYRLALADAQKRVFEMVVRHFETFLDVIPLTFVLGFYVSIVMKRWWDQFMCIPWPDKLVSYVGVYISGNDERGRLIRRSIMRWMNLSSVLIFQSISLPVKKRFPTLQHIVDAGLMTPHEQKLFKDLPSSHHKYWVPCMWSCTLANMARQEGRIKDDILLKSVIDELNSFKYNLGLLYCYDWISIPLVYTQVATLAVYTFCLTSLMGRQYTEPTATNPSSHEIDFYVPVFTLLQFFFYMGWLKVAEVMINPFGEDADDFEMNWMIDRNYQVSMVAVDEMFSSIPPLQKDMYWDDLEPELPYTRSTLQHKPESYMGSTADFSLDGENTELVSPMETIPEHVTFKPTSLLNIPTPMMSGASSPEKTRRFFNNIFSSSSQVDIEALNSNDPAVYSLRNRLRDQLFGQLPFVDRLGFHRSSSNFDDRGSRSRLGSMSTRDHTSNQRQSPRPNRRSNVPTDVGGDFTNGEMNGDCEESDADAPMIHVFEPQSVNDSPLISMLQSEQVETKDEDCAITVLEEGIPPTFARVKPDGDTFVVDQRDGSEGHCDANVTDEKLTRSADDTRRTESQIISPLVEISSKTESATNKSGHSNNDSPQTGSNDLNQITERLNEADGNLQNFSLNVQLIPEPIATPADSFNQPKLDSLGTSRESTAESRVFTEFGDAKNTRADEPPSFIFTESLNNPLFKAGIYDSEQLDILKVESHQMGYVNPVMSQRSVNGEDESANDQLGGQSSRGVTDITELAINSESEKVQEYLNSFVSQESNHISVENPTTDEDRQGYDLQDQQYNADRLTQSEIKVGAREINTNPFYDAALLEPNHSFSENVPPRHLKVDPYSEQQTQCQLPTDPFLPPPFINNHSGPFENYSENETSITHTAPQVVSEIFTEFPPIACLDPIFVQTPGVPETSHDLWEPKALNASQEFLSDAVHRDCCADYYRLDISTPVVTNGFLSKTDDAPSLLSAVSSPLLIGDVVHSASSEDNLSDANTDETCLSSGEFESPYGSPSSVDVYDAGYDTTASDKPLLGEFRGESGD